MMQNGIKESTVTYNEGGAIRTLRGVITEDEKWIIVSRSDGTVRINKNSVIKIEDKPEVNK